MNTISANNLWGARSSYLDIAKGFGIICVVFGHIMPFCPLYYWIYGFHVALFFVISGLLCDFSKYSQIEFIRKRTICLFIPFLFWYFIEIFVVEMTRGGGLFFFRAVWFILILYLVEILYCILKHFLGKFAVFLPYMAFIVVFLLQNVGFHNHFKIESIPAGMFFFGIGNQYKIQIYKSLGWLLKCCYNRWFALTILFAVSLIRVFWEHRTEFPSNSFLLSDYIIALFGIGFVLSISKVLDTSFFLEYIGRNTLIILGVHMSMIVFTVDCIEPLISNHWVFKTIQVVLIWSVAVAAIEIVNRYLPWAAGKPRKR